MHYFMGTLTPSYVSAIRITLHTVCVHTMVCCVCVAISTVQYPRPVLLLGILQKDLRKHIVSQSSSAQDDVKFCFSIPGACEYACVSLCVCLHVCVCVRGDYSVSYHFF